MKWRGRTQSGNIEDRRSGGGNKRLIGGGIGGIVITLLIVLITQDPSALLQLADQAPANQPGLSEEQLAAQKDKAEFTSVVLKDTEDVWDSLFAAVLGGTYVQPKLVLFSNLVESGCGRAGSSTGPFYCPADQKVYIDLTFFDELRDRFGAPGDFAWAYVIAHEVGHHVQNLLGATDRVHRMRNTVSEKEYNQLSVRLELQADFYAGVWAHHAQRMKNILDDEDIREALDAAHAIGDDRLQREAGGHVVPDAFTHGTSEQRMRWFKRGYDTGDLRQGDTFNTSRL